VVDKLVEIGDLADSSGLRHHQATSIKHSLYTAFRQCVSSRVIHLARGPGGDVAQLKEALQAAEEGWAQSMMQSLVGHGKAPELGSPAWAEAKTVLGLPWCEGGLGMLWASDRVEAARVGAPLDSAGLIQPYLDQSMDIAETPTGRRVTAAIGMLRQIGSGQSEQLNDPTLDNWAAEVRRSPVDLGLAGREGAATGFSNSQGRYTAAVYVELGRAAAAATSAIARQLKQRREHPETLLWCHTSPVDRAVGLANVELAQICHLILFGTMSPWGDGDQHCHACGQQLEPGTAHEHAVLCKYKARWTIAAHNAAYRTVAKELQRIAGKYGANVHVSEEPTITLIDGVEVKAASTGASRKRQRPTDQDDGAAESADGSNGAEDETGARAPAAEAKGDLDEAKAAANKLRADILCSVATRGGFGQAVRGNATSAANGDSTVALYNWVLDAVFTTKCIVGVAASHGRKQTAYGSKFTFDPARATFVPLAASYQGCISKASQDQLKRVVMDIRNGAGVDPTLDANEWAWLEEDYNKTRSPKGDFKRVLELLAVQLVRGWARSRDFLSGNIHRQRAHRGPRVDDDGGGQSGHAAGTG
jgi:hypothetical protein